MIDYLATFVNTDGAAFPNTAGKNSTGAATPDGTEYVKAFIDDAWGARQALMSAANLTPDTVTEAVGTSQDLEAMRILFQAQSKNILMNGDMSVSQRGTLFTATSTPANGDDTYLLDDTILLSDGGDIVDVSQEQNGGVSGNSNFIRLDTETIAKKFGILKLIKNKDLKSVIGSNASLSMEMRVSDITKLSDIRAVVVSWDGATDTVTSDIISSWNVEGTRPTLVANWTEENVDSNLGVTAAWVRYKIPAIVVDTAGTKNVGVFIYQNNVATNDTLATTLDITNIQLESGTVVTPFDQRFYGFEKYLCKSICQVIDQSAGVYYFGTGQSIGTASWQVVHLLEREMRTNPALESISAQSHFAMSTAAAAQGTTVTFGLNQSSSKSVHFAGTCGGGTFGIAGQGTQGYTISASARIILNGGL